MPVIVFCPMEIERRAVVRAARAAGLAHLQVVQTGIGKEAVIRAVARSAATAGPETLFMLAGACGGLAESGHVPYIASVIDEHGNRWTPAFANEQGVTLVAVDRVVASPSDKASLAARSGAAIVDMETHAFAAECERRGLRWTVVRGVSDTPEETLPEEVLGWVRPDGGTRAGRAAWDLVRKPWLIPHIVSVVRRANRVLPIVGSRVVELIGEMSNDRGEKGEHAATPIVPMRVDRDCPLVILFGGTFDPPHLGHVELPERIRTELEGQAGTGPAGALVYVPASKSPHKMSGPIAGDADRLAMLEAAIEGRARTTVWTDEVVRGMGRADPSFTFDTVERARAWLDGRGSGGTQLRLLIGTDQALAFHTWREPRRIIEVAEPVVMLRGDDNGGAGGIVDAMRRTGYWSEPELAQWLTRIVPVGRIDISATSVREAFAAGRTAEAEAMLPAAVADFIRRRGLYGMAKGG